MNKEDLCQEVQEKVDSAVRRSQNEILSGIQSMISVEMQKISESQKALSEIQMSKISDLSSSDHKFKRRSNEEQFKVNKKVISKIGDAERNLDVPDIDKAMENLAEASSLLKQRQKVIRIADESELGWKVVDEYIQSEIASDEEDQKRIYRAQSRARVKARVEKIRKSRRAAPYRFRPTTASETTAYNHSSLHQHQQQQKKPGLCFLCGSAGHWKSECPNNKNLKLSIPSTGFCIGSEGLVNSICLDSSISGFISNQPSNVTVEQVSNNEIIVNHGIAGFQTESDFQLNDNSFVSPCGRLKQNSHAWRSITDNEHILSIVENGYRIPFKQLPDVQKSKNNKSARDNPDFVRSEISSLLSKGCISEVTTEPHVINPLTVAFNRKGKPRLVLDCRNVNNCLHKFKYKYEDIQTARLMFEKGTFMFSFDIRGAYHHIDIYPEHRTFLGFSWTENGQIKLYVFYSLPFGLATAGHVFSKVVRTIVKFWRSMGVKVITFLDDGLGGDISYENALLASNFIKESIQNFGFLLANEKCDWDPKLQSVWLGYFICMKSGRLFITEERISRLELAIGSLLSQLKGQFLQIVTARFAASIAGQIISLQNVLGKIVRLKTREMYKCINSRLSWDSPVYISEEAVIELNLWLKSVRDLNCKGTDFKENLDFELSLFCDASSSGYGGYIEMNVSDGSDRYAGTSQEVGSLSLAQAHGASLDNDSPFFLIFGSEKPNVRKHDKIRSPEVDTFKSNSIVSPEVETYGGREMGHKKNMKMWKMYAAMRFLRKRKLAFSI